MKKTNLKNSLIRLIDSMMLLKQNLRRIMKLNLTREKKLRAN